MAAAGVRPGGEHERSALLAQQLVQRRIEDAEVFDDRLVGIVGADALPVEHIGARALVARLAAFKVELRLLRFELQRLELGFREPVETGVHVGRLRASSAPTPSPP